jgi:hypothetical protein
VRAVSDADVAALLARWPVQLVAPAVRWAAARPGRFTRLVLVAAAWWVALWA